MITVTGGAGFIGSYLVESLIEDGHEVLILDNLSTGKKKNIPKGAKLLNFDIRDKNIGDKIRGSEAVFHLAADTNVRSSVVNPTNVLEVNVLGSLNILDAIRKEGITDFIFASSGGTVYGDVSKHVSEVAPMRPISPYGASKAAFEMFMSAYAHSYDLNCIALRLGNVIGPRSEHGIIWDFFWKLKKDATKLEIFGDGNQEKSYIHVSDAVSAFLLTRKKAKRFEPYNVAHESTLTVQEITKLICQELDVTPKLKFTGGERGWKGDVKILKTDTTKLRALGWKPQFSPEEALKENLKWLVSEFGQR